MTTQISFCKLTDHNPNDLNAKPSFQIAGQEIPNKWMKKTLTYCVIRGSDDLPKDSVERRAVNLAFTAWEAESNIILKPVKAIQDPDIVIEWVHGNEDEYFGSDSSILAWAGYPGTQYEGQLVLNDDKIWTEDGKPIDAATYTKLTGKPVQNPANKFKTYNLHQTLRHESGHILGLTHSTSCPECIMNATYNETLDLQPDDISRIRAKYGKRIYKGTWYDIFKNWLARATRRKILD